MNRCVLRFVHQEVGVTRHQGDITTFPTDPDIPPLTPRIQHEPTGNLPHGGI